MTDAHATAGGGPVAEPPERSSAQVWRLGVKVVLVQVVALLLLWVIQAVFAGG
jgi:hypothetical protein